MPYSVPYGTDSIQYAFNQGEMYLSGDKNYYPVFLPNKSEIYSSEIVNAPDFSVPVSLKKKYDLSYPSDDYSCSYTNYNIGCKYIYYDWYEDVGGKLNCCRYEFYQYIGSLAYLPVGEKSKKSINFTTSINITKDYQFHILGHDFTVSPEMLVTEQGDVNCDGAVGVSDVVLLQKWILNNPDAKLINWRTADLNNDDTISVYDLVLLRKKLLEVV